MVTSMKFPLYFSKVMPFKKNTRYFKCFFISISALILLFAHKLLAEPGFQARQKITKVIHIKDYGAVGDGIANDTKAFQKAAAFLQKNGGTLIIDPGTYIVGKQRLSGSYLAGSSYFEEPILEFKNATKPIIIKGYKAILKAANGLKYGFFNPITGLPDSIRKQGNRSSYYATAYIFVNAVGCKSISVKGLTLDGNSEKLNISSSHDDIGIQLMATGIRMYNNESVDIEDCYIHHCGLDAIIIAWTGLKNTDPIYSHTIKNVIASYNGRQGLSWVGGNNLTVVNSQFSSTGKAVNNNKPVVSKPSAGIDIEVENSIIKNGHFINCYVNDNAGAGIISIGQDTYNINFKNCRFIGTSNSAAYPKSAGFSFDSCTFVGKVERIFGSSDKSKATFFKDCLFTMDKKMSPTGKVFGDRCEFYEAQNVVFDRCRFDADSTALPVFNNKEIVFVNCSFSQDNNTDFNASAIFKGTTHFYIPEKKIIKTEESKFEGEVILNHN
jgi:hypothetical protein